MNIAAFLTYMFLTAYTPGPNNMMAMSNAARGGLRRGLVFCFGVLIGCFLDMCLCAIFTVSLSELIPAMMPFMRWVGAGYILFLAVSIYRDKAPKSGAKQYLKPDSVLTGMLMQFVNVKVILYGMTAMTSFVLPYSQSLPVLAGAVIALTLVGVSGNCCWAAFGALFQRFFERHKKPMNLSMALLLVLCAVMVLV